MYQIDVPSNFDGDVFVNLFEFLLTKKQTLAIGLYRQNELRSHYVWCNPQQQTILKKTDKVFV